MTRFFKAAEQALDNINQTILFTQLGRLLLNYINFADEDNIGMRQWLILSMLCGGFKAAAETCRYIDGLINPHAPVVPVAAAQYTPPRPNS